MIQSMYSITSPAFPTFHSPFLVPYFRPPQFKSLVRDNPSMEVELDEAHTYNLSTANSEPQPVPDHSPVKDSPW
jgi:hypothetical protein